MLKFPFLCRLVTLGSQFLYIDLVGSQHLHHRLHIWFVIYSSCFFSSENMIYFFSLMDSKYLILFQASPHSHNQTVVVQNPMTVDESGKLVSYLKLANSDQFASDVFIFKREKTDSIYVITGEQCCCWCNNIGMQRNGTWITSSGLPL